MKFSDRLKEAMEFRNFRQVDLVNSTKIDKGTISNYLSGKYEPKSVNAVLIADALNVNLPWLLGHDVPMEKDQYVEYSASENNESYLTIEWEKDFGANITKEKWAEFYDKIMSLPEPMKLDVLKYVVLSIQLADMKEKMHK